MTPFGDHAMLFARQEDYEEKKAAQIFSRAHGIPMIDGQRMAKRSWGFLGENIDASQASALSREAEALGIKTVLVKSDLVASLPPLQPVPSGRFLEEGFCFSAGPGAETVAPWGSVVLIGAVCLSESISVKKTVKEEASKGEKALGLGIRAMTGGMSFGVGKSKEVQKTFTSTELFLSLDLFTRSPSARLHIDAQHFNFGCLGGRMLMNTLGNFKLLLADFEKFAPGRFNRGARSMLKNQPLSSLGYESRADYEKECRWLLTLTRTAP